MQRLPPTSSAAGYVRDGIIHASWSHRVRPRSSTPARVANMQVRKVQSAHRASAVIPETQRKLARESRRSLIRMVMQRIVQ